MDSLAIFIVFWVVLAYGAGGPIIVAICSPNCGKQPSYAVAEDLAYSSFNDTGVRFVEHGLQVSNHFFYVFLVVGVETYRVLHNFPYAPDFLTGN